MAAKWYFTRQQLNKTPSRDNGIDYEKELSYRQQAANLIQDMGQRLSVTQLCINTAIVYMHRFYMFQSFTKFHRTPMSTACLFLAAKVEEQPRRLEHVLKTAHSCLHRDKPPLDVTSNAYLEMAQELVNNEHILLQSLGFEITIEHPHTYVVRTCQLVRASKDLAQTSYFLATNSLHLTTMCLEYSPKIVCCVCILLACKWANWEIPKSSEGKDWVWYVDQSITMEEVERLTQDFLNILDKCPSKLKNKLMANKSQEEEGERSEGTPSDLADSIGLSSRDGAGYGMQGAVEDYPVDHGDLSNIHDYGAGGSGEISEGRQADVSQESSLRRVQTEPVLSDRGHHSSAAAHRPPMQQPAHHQIGGMPKDGVKHSMTAQQHHQQSSSSRPPPGVPPHGAMKPSASGSRPQPSASSSHPPGGDKLREGHHASQMRPGQPSSSSSQHPGASVPRSSQHGAPPPSSGSLQHRPPPSSSSHAHGSEPAEKVRRLDAAAGGDANRHHQQQQQQRPRDHGHHSLPPSSSASHGARPDATGMRPEGHSSSSVSRQSSANVRHDRRPDDRHSGVERRPDDHSGGRERRDSHSERARNHQSSASGSGHRSYDSHTVSRHSTSSSASGSQRPRLHSGGSSEAETRPPSSLSRETSREEQRLDSSANPPESEEVIAKRRQELIDSLEEGEVNEELEKLDHISPVKTLAGRDPMRNANVARSAASTSISGRSEVKSSSSGTPSNGSGPSGQHAMPPSLASAAASDVEKEDQGKLTPTPLASGSSARLPIAAILNEDAAAHRNSPKVKVSLSDYRDRIKTAPAPEPEQPKSRSGDIGSRDTLASLRGKDLPDVFSLFDESSGRQSPTMAPPPAVKLKLPKFGEAIKLGMAAAAAEEALANSAAANDELNITEEGLSVQEGVEPAAGETPVKLVLKVKKDTVSGQYSSSTSKHSSAEHHHRHHSHHGHRQHDPAKGGDGSRSGGTEDQHDSRKRARSPAEQHRGDKHRRTSSSASSSERHPHHSSSASKRLQPNGSDAKDEKQRVEQLQVIQSTIELISQMSKTGPPPPSSQ